MVQESRLDITHTRSSFILRLFSSLRFRLILLVLLAMLPAIILILHAGFEGRKIAAAQAREDTQRLLELASMQQSRVIKQTHGLLVALSENPLCHSDEMGQCSAYLAELVRNQPQYLNLGIIGADGRILGSVSSVAEDLNLSNREFFQHVMEKRGLAIRARRAGPNTAKTFIDFGYPLDDAEAKEKGIVFASVDLGWLSEFAISIGLSEGATLTLADREGTVIARYPDPDRWVGKVMPRNGILHDILNRENDGTAEAVGIDGVKRLYTFTPVDVYPDPIFLYTGIPTDTVYAKANRTMVRNLIALGCTAILTLLAAHFFGHLFIMRSVNALVRTVRQLAGGDLSARANIGAEKGELGELGRVFDEMAEALEKRAVEHDLIEEALRGSEARYRTLVEQIPVVTYTAELDEAHTIRYISPRVDSLLGYDQEDFYENRDTWSKKLHPEDRSRVLKEWSRCQKDKDLFICEYRMLTFNNMVKWIRDEAVIVTSDAGESLCIQGVMVDITEQKRSEEELVSARHEIERRVEQRTEELAKANEDLRRGAETLKSLASTVVHDLKSPAIGAYGLTKLLRKQYGDSLDEKGMRYCNQIMKASEHIVELTQEINAYMASKETPLRIETVDLGKILDALKEEFFSRLRDRGIKWFEPETSPCVRADRLCVLRAFRNYIDNALKYGGEELSEIRIEYQESDKLHIFSVADDGQGVSSEDVEKIFQMFQRSGSSSGIEGVGLGLSIVREVAEKHGGTASVEAGSKKGVTFSFSISKDL